MSVYLLMVLWAIGLLLLACAVVFPLFTGIRWRLVIGLVLGMVGLICLNTAYRFTPDDLRESESVLQGYFYDAVLITYHATPIILWIMFFVLLVGLIFALIPAFDLDPRTGAVTRIPTETATTPPAAGGTVVATATPPPPPSGGGVQWRQGLIILVALIIIAVSAIASSDRLAADENESLYQLARYAKKAGIKAKPDQIHLSGDLLDRDPLTRKKLITMVENAYKQEVNDDPEGGILKVEKIHSFSFFAPNRKNLDAEVVIFSGKIICLPDRADDLKIENGSIRIPLAFSADETSAWSEGWTYYFQQRKAVPVTLPMVLPNGGSTKGVKWQPTGPPIL